MKPTEIAKAIDASFGSVKEYIDRGFAIVEERLAALEKFQRESEIEAEVRKRIAKGAPNG